MPQHKQGRSSPKAQSHKNRKLWGSIASMGRHTHRKKYKKLMVFFEVGQHVGWPQSATCEYGDAVTIGQLAENLAKKHVNVSPALAKHFALVLVDAKGISPSTAIEWSTNACDVDQQMESLNSDAMPGKWQLRLKMLVPPQSATELKDSDPAAFEYYFAQIVNDFIGSTYTKLASEDILHLGTILIRHCLLSGDFHAGHITEDLVHSLSQEIGLSKFFPARYLVVHNRSGRLTSQILTAMKKFCTNQDTPALCQTRFLEVLGAVDPTLGLVTYQCEAGPEHSARTPGTLVVDPVDGLYFENQGGRKTTICSFTDVIAVQTGGDTTVTQLVHRGPSGGTTEIWELDSPSHTVAEAMVVVIDLHRRVLAATSGETTPVPSPTKRTPKSARKSSAAVVPTAVSTAQDDNGKAAENVGEPEATSESEGDEAEDDDDKFMALSETARDSLHMIDEDCDDDDERKSWEIPIAQLRITQVLGKGEFGEVQKGLWRYTPKQLFDVAVKTVKPKPGFEEQQEEFLTELLDEAALMMRLDHPNIVTLYGIAYRDDMPMIIMELMPLGELKDFVMLQKDKLKGSTLAMSYVCQVAEACKYLHSLNIIHRDLAARNILIKDPVTVKVADFGLSRYCEEVYTIRGQKKMPLKWMAPECINFRRHTKKSDVWMFAVTAWEIMSYGKKPFQTMAVKKYIAEIQRGVRLQKPLGCPQPLYAVLLSCWKYDSVDRPDFTKIVAQLTAVMSMFPKREVSDDLWERLGGAKRGKGDEHAAPIRPKIKAIGPFTAGGAPVHHEGTNPFDGEDDDANSTADANTPAAGPAASATNGSASRHKNPFASAASSTGDEPSVSAAPAEVDNTVVSPTIPASIEMDPDVADGLGLIIALINGSGAAVTTESPEEKAVRRKARKAAKLAEKLRLARAAILQETGVDPGELDFLALNGGIGAKAAPPVAVKKKKAPVVAARKQAPPVAPKRASRSSSLSTEETVAPTPVVNGADNVSAVTSDNEMDVVDDEDEPEQENDYSVDLSPDARSRDRKLTFGDSISWTIFAPKPLANTVDRKDAFSIRCARVVQSQVKLKELGENPDPDVYIPLVLQLCTALEGMIIETRFYLNNTQCDMGRRVRVETLAKGLGPRLQTFLESAADAVINYGDNSHAILWQDTLKAASMVAVGCVSLCEASMASRTGSYAMFKPKQPNA
eukprot:m.118287 g.118287  ORF g.118287 m.118287 type:complete len:1187 (+) comp10974_c0_seq1:213-3773(+)